MGLYDISLSEREKLREEGVRNLLWEGPAYTLEAIRTNNASSRTLQNGTPMSTSTLGALLVLVKVSRSLTHSRAVRMYPPFSALSQSLLHTFSNSQPINGRPGYPSLGLPFSSPFATRLPLQAGVGSLPPRAWKPSCGGPCGGLGLNIQEVPITSSNVNSFHFTF